MAQKHDQLDPSTESSLRATLVWGLIGALSFSVCLYTLSEGHAKTAFAAFVLAVLGFYQSYSFSKIRYPGALLIGAGLLTISAAPVFRNSLYVSLLELIEILLKRSGLPEGWTQFVADIKIWIGSGEIDYYKDAICIGVGLALAALGAYVNRAFINVGAQELNSAIADLRNEFEEAQKNSKQED